jgi:hypothetical protein
VRDLRPDSSKSDTETEEEIADTVKEFRRNKKAPSAGGQWGGLV